MSGVCVEQSQVKSFVERVMVASGAKPSHASILADNLLIADYRGHFTHGLHRLELYSVDIRCGCTNGHNEPIILSETAAIAHVDGNNILGQVVGKFCMQLAIKKAKNVGIGFVCCRGSNHYGIAGYYSLMASDQNLIGFSITNTSPIIAPTRSKDICLGTNPISLAAPALNDDNFVLDMACSAVAFGKVELANMKDVEIPLGWAVDSDGKVTKNPKSVLNGGSLLPLGGAEITSGYKGYGLAMMVEVLCGVLSGGLFGGGIKLFRNTERPSDLSHCFIAIDPKFFAPDFNGRLQELMESYRNSEPVDEALKVLVAGDPERKHMQKCDEMNCIEYHPNLINELNKLADGLNVERIVCK